jgi:hypothetical protein
MVFPKKGVYDSKIGFAIITGDVINSTSGIDVGDQ